MHELTSFQAERLKIVETSRYTRHIPLSLKSVQFPTITERTYQNFEV